MKIGSKFKTLFDQACIGFAFVESRTGRFRKANKKFFELMGLEKNSASKTTVIEKNHPEALHQDLDMMQKLLGGGLKKLTIKKNYPRKDGSLVFLNLTVSALLGVGDQPDYHLLKVEDITLNKIRPEKLHVLKEVLTPREEGSNATIDDPS